MPNIVISVVNNLSGKKRKDCSINHKKKNVQNKNIAIQRDIAQTGSVNIARKEEIPDLMMAFKLTKSRYMGKTY